VRGIVKCFSSEEYKNIWPLFAIDGASPLVLVDPSSLSLEQPSSTAIFYHFFTICTSLYELSIVMFKKQEKKEAE